VHEVAHADQGPSNRASQLERGQSRLVQLVAGLPTNGQQSMTRLKLVQSLGRLGMSYGVRIER
jgi:hypothetical protein